MADQVASSAGNFLLLFLLARTSQADDFGLLAIAFAIVTFGLAIGRSAIGTMVNLVLPTANRALAREELRRSTAASLLLSLIVLLLLFTYAFIVRGESSVAGSVVIFACSMPVLLVQDLWRYGSVAQGRSLSALLSDTVWLGVTGAAFTLNLVGELQLTATWASAAWAFGLVLGAVVLLLSGAGARPWFASLLPWLTSDRRRRQLGLDALLASTGPLLLLSAVGAVAGSSQTGALRGASTMFGPINTLFAAVSLGAVSEARRRWSLGARKLLLVIAAALVLVVGLWGTISLLLPARVGASLLGETWDLTRPLLPFTMWEYMGLALWAGAMALLQATERVRIALKFRVWYTSAALVTACSACFVFKNALAVAISLAASGMTLGICGLSVAYSRKPN